MENKNIKKALDALHKKYGSYTSAANAINCSQAQLSTALRFGSMSIYLAMQIEIATDGQVKSEDLVLPQYQSQVKNFKDFIRRK